MVQTYQSCVWPSAQPRPSLLLALCKNVSLYHLFKSSKSDRASCALEVNKVLLQPLIALISLHWIYIKVMSLDRGQEGLPIWWFVAQGIYNNSAQTAECKDHSSLGNLVKSNGGNMDLYMIRSHSLTLNQQQLVCVLFSYLVIFVMCVSWFLLGVCMLGVSFVSTWKKTYLFTALSHTHWHTDSCKHTHTARWSFLLAPDVCRISQQSACQHLSHQALNTLCGGANSSQLLHAHQTLLYDKDNGILPLERWTVQLKWWKTQQFLGVCK